LRPRSRPSCKNKEDTKLQDAHYEGYHDHYEFHTTRRVYHDHYEFNTTPTTPTKNTKIF
jgi:hypothetical protein